MDLDRRIELTLRHVGADGQQQLEAKTGLATVLDLGLEAGYAGFDFGQLNLSRDEVGEVEGTLQRQIHAFEVAEIDFHRRHVLARTHETGHRDLHLLLLRVVERQLDVLTQGADRRVFIERDFDAPLLAVALVAALFTLGRRDRDFEVTMSMSVPSWAHSVW